jgi:indoleamine 2,3-dioxygenase
LIHVAIEQQAAPAIAAISDAHNAILSNDVSRVSQSLRAMKDTLCVMLETLKRMQTACDPHIYYHRYAMGLGDRGSH